MSKCNNCIFKGNVAGSTHLTCNFFGDITEKMKLWMRTRGSTKPISLKDENGKIVHLVELDETGIKNGWCTYPLDFDPIWVTSCKLYKSK